ncbi:hypothetical protein Tco_0588027, partial [Tanacetum coccineum]
LGNMISMKNEGTAEMFEGTKEVHEGTAQVNESTAKVNESTAEKIKVPLLFVKVPLVLSDILERSNGTWYGVLRDSVVASEVVANFMK